METIMDYFEQGYHDGVSGNALCVELSKNKEYSDGWCLGMGEKLQEDMMKLQEKMFIKGHKC